MYINNKIGTEPPKSIIPQFSQVSHSALQSKVAENCRVPEAPSVAAHRS